MAGVRVRTVVVNTCRDFGNEGVLLAVQCGHTDKGSLGKGNFKNSHLVIEDSELPNTLPVFRASLSASIFFIVNLYENFDSIVGRGEKIQFNLLMLLVFDSSNLIRIKTVWSSVRFPDPLKS